MDQRNDPSTPGFSPADQAYVEAEYATLEQLCAHRTGEPHDPEQVRRLVAAGQLPGPAYVLPDGREMFWPDYFDLVDAAGGVDALHDHFVQQHRAATNALGLPGVDPEEDWRGYLSGDYGVCLCEVIPEAMVEKTALVSQIDALIALPAPADDQWRRTLTGAVDELDEILRPFTDHDRQRWGGTSRDSHVAGVRARFLTSDATTD
jgi:hypothetical protein